ncbi:MAG: pentapeptide repeat-containing protein, partial [Cytophagales bacterium]|nr:pentapeptide repeat-containing protein [Cytophagales bacterium]
MLIIVTLLSLPYYRTQFENFYPQVLAEAHGMIFDMFLIGVLMFWMETAKEKRTKIAHYTEELEDIITIGTQESALRVLILIKRLNRLKVSDMKLTGLRLVNGNLNRC